MLPEYKIELRNEAEVAAFLDNLGDPIAQGIEDTTPEVGALVLADQGGGHPFYPRPTEHNAPPVPYYERYTGEQWDAFTNDHKSEQMGERFTVTYHGPREVWIENSASYAPDVIGDIQNPFFATIGWMKLIDVANNVSDGIAEWWARGIAAAIAKAEPKNVD